MNKQDVLKVLDAILDPDLRDRSIVEMGFVGEDDIEITEEEMWIRYTVGGPLCPYSAAIGIIIHQALRGKFNGKIRVQMKKGHYQEDVVNKILGDESRFEEWFERIKAQNLLTTCLRAPVCD
jgi:metal-sulfur cluster biosynthetic enzyme